MISPNDSRTGSILIFAVLLGRHYCVREILKFKPKLDSLFHCTSVDYAQLNKLNALEIAQKQCKLDIVKLLTEPSLIDENDPIQMAEKMGLLFFSSNL